MGIIAVIQDVAAVVGAINQIASILNKPRSIVGQINNRTDAALNLLSFDDIHGGFAQPPSQQIPPKSAMIFGHQSRAWSVGTGSEGKVVYRDGGFDITCYWDNPFIATFWEGKGNSATASVGGQDAGLYTATAIAGAGDQAAIMLYELFLTPITQPNISDGVMMRERGSAPVYVIFGGAKFHLSTDQWVRSYGGWNAVQVVPDGSLGSVPGVPSDGYILREWSDSAVYLMKGGQRFHVTSPQRFNQLGLAWSNVKVVPDGALTPIPFGGAA